MYYKLKKLLKKRFYKYQKASTQFPISNGHSLMERFSPLAALKLLSLNCSQILGSLPSWILHWKVSSFKLACIRGYWTFHLSWAMVLLLEYVLCTMQSQVERCTYGTTLHVQLDLIWVPGKLCIMFPTLKPKLSPFRF